MTAPAQRLRQLTSGAIALSWRAEARLRGIDLRVSVHPTASIGRGARIAFLRGPQRTASLTLGPGSRLEGGSLIQLTGGGQIDIGAGSVVRRSAVLNVSGQLILSGDNLVSWHSVIHCAERVVMERQAGTGEGVTVVDGRHFRRDVDDHWYHNSSTSPVHVGANVWLASHCVIGPGVTIGRATTVAANSVVLGDLPENALVAGSPATVIRADVLAHPQPKETA